MKGKAAYSLLVGYLAETKKSLLIAGKFYSRAFKWRVDSMQGYSFLAVLRFVSMVTFKADELSALSFIFHQI